MSGNEETEWSGGHGDSLFLLLYARGVRVRLVTVATFDKIGLVQPLSIQHDSVTRVTSGLLLPYVRDDGHGFTAWLTN